MSSIIKMESVDKNYQVGTMEIQALKKVNFEIKKGEFVVVLGASGAGKSTILNILGGMDTVSSGSIVVDGSNISKYNERQLTQYRAEQIGFVFQFYNLIPNLTALENVEFASEVCKKPLNAVDILKAVGLENRMNNFPSQLSGGEQQRVAIARAVAKNPLLLLCDEPTGALDYKTGKEVLKLLQNLNKDMKTSIVLITHNSALAMMADRVIHVRSGEIEKIEMNNIKSPVEEMSW